MSRFLQRMIMAIARFMLSLRYRVTVEGLEQIQDLDGPVLVLPNHPAYIDPPLILTHIRLKQTLRPLVYAGTYRSPFFYPLMKLINAKEVPHLAEQSQAAKNQALEMIDVVAEDLNRGDSFLIYPAGRLQRQIHEVVGAARSAAELIQRCPDVQIVLVRNRGLWGSMFGFAQTGELPHLGRCALRGAWYGITSLFFFLPRREIRLTVELVDRDQLPGTSRETLNPYLEEWYNRDLWPARYVPYHPLFGKRDFDFPDLKTSVDYDWNAISEAVRDNVNQMVEEHLGKPLGESATDPYAKLDTIGLDSLDRMDVALEIERRFGFRSHSVATTLGELWALAAGLSTNSDDHPDEVPAEWTTSSPDADPVTIDGDNMYEALVHRVAHQPNAPATADNMSGVLSYRRFLVATRVLGQQFANLEGDAVGVMLPASVAADIVFFGLHGVNKLPVMLNFTTGPRNMAHAVKALNIRYVITSKRFVDRLGVEIEGAEYIFLEDVKANVSKLSALWQLLRIRFSPRAALSGFQRPSPDDPAVVLFTSGSENAPKAVPLSHRNVITNIGVGATALGFRRNDILLGFLPPFHSFGLAGNIVMPLLTGVRVIHYADPTDSAGLAKTIAGYKPSLLFTTPTFLGYLCGAAEGDDFASLRIVITGAEKCPDEVRQQCAELAPDAVIAEGYGITECSPVVSVNRPENVRWGTIGQPLDVLDVCVVHPDSQEPLAQGETGLLLVKGPTVFNGYLNYDGPSPFVEIESGRYYNTGDLVCLDEEGFIHFRGRLKRFLKVAGEMVSLPALEEPIATSYPPNEDGPQVAIEGIETEDGGRCIVLFSVQPIEVREANRLLEEAGFRGIMRIDQVQVVDAIPVLGTGKIDYKQLRRRVEELAGGAAGLSAAAPAASEE